MVLITDSWIVRVPQADGSADGARGLGMAPGRLGPSGAVQPEVSAVRCVKQLGGMRSSRGQMRKGTEGIEVHDDDAGRWAVGGAIAGTAAGATAYPVRLQAQPRAVIGFSNRILALGPARRPCKQPVCQHWERPHTLSRWEGGQACQGCGRPSRKGKRQARLKQWRHPCIVLK